MYFQNAKELFRVQVFPEMCAINLIGYSLNFHVAYLSKRELEMLHPAKKVTFQVNNDSQKMENV
jgi:hypothetical protein